MSLSPRTHQEEAEQPPTAAKVNAQRSNNKTRTEFFLSHVGRATNAHELVTNNNPSLQESKEATGHSTGQQ
jgi:hypothetical protein